MQIKRHPVVLLLVFALALPGSVPALEEARALLRESQWDEAAAAYERLLPELEGDAAASARLNLGRALEELGRIEEAAAQFRGVESVAGAEGVTIYDARLRLGGLLLAQEAYAAAETVFAATVPRVLEITGTGAGIGWKREERATSMASYARALRQDDPAFWIAPYVTLVTDSEARIAWVSRGEFSGSVTMTGGEQEIRVDAERVELRHAPGYWLHSVRSGNLPPASRLTYRAESGESHRTGSFRTAPSPGDRSALNLVVYGDTQDRPGFHRQVSESIARDEPDFVLHTGDMVGPGSQWWAWKVEFFDPAAAWLTGSPVIPTVGNHDGHLFYDPLFLGGGELHQSFVFGNLQIFVLPSYRGGAVDSDRRRQRLEWFRAELTASRADWKIVLTHYPMLSENPTHWVNWGQEDFLPLMESGGVDLVFTGHQHYYRRFLPVGQPGHNPVFHITSGGGASVLGDYGHAGEGQPIPPSPLLVSGHQALHHLAVNIEGPRLELEARLRDGSLLDRLVLSKTEGRLQPEMLAQAVASDLARRIVRLYRDLLQDDRGLAMPRMPASQEAIELKLRLPGLPDGSRLLVAASETDDWQVAEQNVVITAGEGLLRATAAPAFNPQRAQLRLIMTPEIEGRRFQSGDMILPAGWPE